MARLGIMALLLSFMLTGSAVAADCGSPWPVVRDPAVLAELVSVGRLSEDEAALLEQLAARRQGVAAKLLELRYAIGKTVANAADDEEARAGQVAELRRQVAAAEQQLAFIDDEIARTLAALCAE